jgi:tetratricopeptide (TPR) repeat protein
LKTIKSDEKGLKLNNVEVSSYASPDGAYDLNENLANNRGKNSESYVNQQLKKQKLSGDVDTKYTAEDWDGFKELVQQSNLQDKDVILRVLSMYSDPEQREQEIKNISSVYKELADAVLPELRRSRLTINYDVIGRSDEEILAQFSDDASKLSVEELLYAANKLTTDAAKKETILKKTTELYPKDYRAYNNLGELAYKKGDNATASDYFKKALSINSKAAEPNVNLGLIALQNGDAKTAESYIAKGTAANNYDEALGQLYIAQGKYSQAIGKLNNSNSNSAALAYILNKDYSKAKTVLNNIKEADATTYYLAAVLAARTNSTTDLVSNLKKAVDLNNNYAKKAANDAEFKSYAESIASIVK